MIAGYLALAAICLLPLIVLARILVMKRHGIQAMKFAGTDRRDFLILPFALFYFYVVFAAAFGADAIAAQQLFRSAAAAWLGVILCYAGLAVLIASIVSFGRSFRVGIDTANPDTLVTTGIFAHSRNPIYGGFALVLCGEFLTFQNWIMLLYLAAGVWLFHRQVLLEEAYLATRYGEEYARYRAQVRRYL